jgi:hypothetical protein
VRGDPPRLRQERLQPKGQFIVRSSGRPGDVEEHLRGSSKDIRVDNRRRYTRDQQRRRTPVAANRIERRVRSRKSPSLNPDHHRQAIERSVEGDGLSCVNDGNYAFGARRARYLPTGKWRREQRREQNDARRHTAVRAAARFRT